MLVPCNAQAEAQVQANEIALSFVRTEERNLRRGREKLATAILNKSEDGEGDGGRDEVFQLPSGN